MQGHWAAGCRLEPNCSAPSGSSHCSVSWLHSSCGRQYGKDYVPLEEAAQAAKRGIWSGSFELPAKWRQSHPRSGSPAAAAAGAAAPAAVVAAAGAPAAALPAGPGAAGAQAPPGCAIKGNITAKGEKIYHVPGAIPCLGHVFAAGLP